MIKLDAIINDKKLLASIQKGVDKYNKSTAGRSKLNLKINEKGFRQPLGRITGDVDKFESALAASNARVIAFGASTAVIGGITKAFKELAKTTALVEKNFADINRILNISNRQFENFSTQLFDISKKTATSFEDASKGALEFARQGLGLNETLTRTADALTLVRLTGVNADKAVSALTATVNAFQQSSLTTTEALNKFVAVETKFAVSARDLMEGLGRVGSAAVDAKVNFNELNAMIAAVQQQTGRGGAVIGNALKTIFTRLQRTDTLTALESYGIAVRNIEGQTRPAMAILQDFAKTYDTLADSNKAYLREQVAGVFQANILSAIVKDLNSNTQVYNRALDTSVKATNEADQANAKLNRTLSAMLSQTGIELVRLQENIGKVTIEPIAKALLGPFKGLLEGINNILDSEGIGGDIANGLLKGIRNVLAGPGLVGAIAIIGVTMVKTIGFMATALPTLVGITSETQKRANLEASITAMLGSSATLAKQIAGSEGNAAVQAGIILAAADKAALAFQKQATSTAAIAANLAKAGMTTSAMGAIVPKGRGAFGRGAGGYIPGVAGEIRDIQRGRGGVSSTERPVHIPNFAFGGGERGSMIANTGEHIVPNFKGGGSAVFNPAMVRANGGLPQGAKKITAAQGYVPNFAQSDDQLIAKASASLAKGKTAGVKVQITQISTANPQRATLMGRYETLRRTKTKKQPTKTALNTFEYPASTLGVGAVVGMRTHSPPYSPFSSFGTLMASKNPKKTGGNVDLQAYMSAPENKAKRLKISKIPVGALDKLGRKGKGSAELKQRFSGRLNNFMLPALDKYTSNIFKTVLGDDGGAFIAELQKNKQRIFSTATEGGIFESALQLASRNAKSFRGDDMARFDFEETGPISSVMKNTFFKSKHVIRADAKRSDSRENMLTLVGKSLGTPEIASTIRSGGQMNKAITDWKKTKRGAGGYMPNFAGGYTPNFVGGGLGAAINREKGAGIPSSSIRINSDPRFQTPQNPAGFAVTNNIDEPRGLRDVPNFAGTPSPFKGVNFGEMARLGFPRTAAGADAYRAHQAKAARGAGMGGGMAAMGFMMAAPVIGGMGEQAIGGQAGSAFSGATTGAATGAMIGMIGGAPGAIAGGVIGGVAGGIGAFIASAETAAEALTKFTTQMNTNITAGDAFVKAQKGMADSSDMDTYRESLLAATDAMYAIEDPELAKALRESTGEFEELTKILKEYKSEQLKELVFKRALNRAEELGKTKAASKQKGLRTVGGDISSGGGYKDQAAADAARERMGEKVFAPMLQYFKSTGKTPKELESVVDVFQIIAKDTQELASRAFGHIDVTGAQTKSRVTDILSSAKRFDKGGKLVPMFEQEEIEGLSRLFGETLDPGMTAQFGDQTQKVLLEYIRLNLDGFLMRMTKDAKEQSKKAAKKVEQKQNFTEAFKTIMGDINADILDSARKTRAAANAIARRSARQAGRASLLGRAVDPSQLFIERHETAAMNLGIKRQVQAQPIIGQFGGAMGDALKRINQAGGMGQQDRLDLERDLIGRFRGGDIQGAIGTLQNRLMGTGIKKEDRKTLEDLARNLQKAWGKAGDAIDQEQFVIEQKFREDLVRKEILAAERDIMLQKHQYLSDLKIQTTIEDAMLKSRLTDIELRGADPANLRGRGVLGKQAFLADIQEEKILARQQTERTKLDLQLNADRAQIDAQHLLNKSTIALVDVNYDLLKALTLLTPKPADEPAGGKPTLSETIATGRDWSTGKATPKPKGSNWIQDAVGAIPLPSKKGDDLGTTKAKRLPDGTVQFGDPDALPTVVIEKGKLPPSAIEKDIVATRELTTYEKQNIELGKKRAKQMNEELTHKYEILDVSQEELKINQDISHASELGDMDKRRDFAQRQTRKNLTFVEGFKNGMEEVEIQGESIMHMLGDQLPIKLRDGLVTAMEAGLDGAQSIGDAMRAMAVDVLKMIRGAFLQRIATNIVGAIPGGGKKEPTFRGGGLIRAQAGLSVPGAGIGDKVPIMAEPHEYVLNRNAVAAMGGERALDRLNFNVAPRFGSKMAANEDPFSSRMSGLYYATGSPELEELAAKMREKDEKRAAKKAEKRALWTSFATMVASAAVFKGMDAASDKWGKREGWASTDPSKWPGKRDFSTKEPIGFSAPTPEKQDGGIVRRYGLGSGYQAGGSVQALSSPASSTNNISINISTGSSDQQRSGGSKQGGQEINADGGGTAREFSMKVAAAVRTVIAEEQRVGGTLSAGARRR